MGCADFLICLTLLLFLPVPKAKDEMNSTKMYCRSIEDDMKKGDMAGRGTSRGWVSLNCRIFAFPGTNCLDQIEQAGVHRSQPEASG